ncbi:MAG: arginine--tRNA ligase, partial [Bacteroidetes bacterium]|nr:arginine--tRNA ligase [Bacteroidota bacterium]
EYGVTLSTVDLVPTKKEFVGDITLVAFSMLKLVKANPTDLCNSLGTYLCEAITEITSFTVVGGFLNLSLSDDYLLDQFSEILNIASFGQLPATGHTVMVEYSSPNTNKPLHLGHVRNNVLGYSVAEILKAAGNEVIKTQIINDRGIHICKSMVAWKQYGDGETPSSSGMKGDHLVGKYYVIFDLKYREQQEELISQGYSKEEAAASAPIFKSAQEYLRLWESGDEEVLALWNTMNSWVYNGFDSTYTALGVDFDHLYYESQTYLLGRDIIDEGLKKGVFYQKEDGSVWADLSDEGLDQKLVLRSDGTAVYMTQDLGTAVQRVKDHQKVDGMVYTVGNEQDYHFKVLFLLLKKLGYQWADRMFHLSYGMVDLPSGKMKSREGKVVDADDLIEEMTQTAGTISAELGKLDGFSEDEKQQLYSQIGLGALKYFILKVDPKKRILFDPEASVDFQGNTGPFIQYTYARIRSILRRAQAEGYTAEVSSIELHEKERELILQLQSYPSVVALAAQQYSPALIANYTYDLVKWFNSFYQQVSILAEEDLAVRNFRILLCKKVSEVIAHSMSLLGITVPERM